MPSRRRSPRNATRPTPCASCRRRRSEIRFTLRRVIGEDGDVQMVVLEASFNDPALVSRVETAMEGAHGMVIPAEALAAAKAS